jgi:hypothetical protein
MLGYQARRKLCPPLQTQYIQNPRVPGPNVNACPCAHIPPVTPPNPPPPPPPPPSPPTVWNPISAFGDGGFATSVAYGNERWVVVGANSSNDHNIYWSSNLSTWNPISAFDFGGFGQSVATDGSGRWVAVGANTNNDKNIYWSSN